MASVELGEESVEELAATFEEDSAVAAAAGVGFSSGCHSGCLSLRCARFRRTSFPVDVTTAYDLGSSQTVRTVGGCHVRDIGSSTETG